MSWEIEGTDEFADWYGGLAEDEQDAVIAAVQVIEERGPAAKRPIVGTVKGSRHHNLKELRVPRHDIRVIFAFDPRRTAILLIGGSKTGEWKQWYRRIVPVAERLYDTYLSELREEGLIDDG